MMEKGFDATVLDSKQSLIELINSQLSEGVPPTVIQMILQLISNDLDKLVEKTIREQKNQLTDSEEIVEE